MKYLCFAVLLTAALSLTNAEGCRQLSSCVSCTEDELSFNFSCKWVTCGDSENSSCVTSEEQIHESCLVSNRTSMCAGPENRSGEAAEMPSEDSPQSKTLSPPVFHVGSFIGGGVLVILLQTVGYFVLKHLRGPERDYQTIAVVGILNTGISLAVWILVSVS